MDQSVNHRFTSRIGLLLSTLGIAVGTGNIWRFPRIAAQNGGDEGAGVLIIAWIICLLIWSIPLIIAEYFIGRKFRSGVVGSFSLTMGGRYAWMGGFVAFVATAISFFYAVIVGWGLFYLGYFIFNPLPAEPSGAIELWERFQSGPWPFLLHLLVVVLGGLAIGKGIRSIERLNKILIPSLILIIFLALIRALTLPGSMDGIVYLFRPDWSQFSDPSVWLHALTQNAWDTGAGWGLFLTYAAYMKVEHGSVKNAFITGIGNNTISLLMAMMIFGTVFSLMKTGMGFTDSEVLEIMRTSGPAGTGLTFIWIPRLFDMMPYGGLLAILFFLGLVSAGFTSMISMFEMTTRNLIDRGISRKKSIFILLPLVYLLGVPSAISLDILSNQDFVWGIGLMISGAFISLAAIRFGLKDLMAGESFTDWRAGLWWNFSIKYIVPMGVIALLVWWTTLSVSLYAQEEWWNPLEPFSIMSCLVQWGVVIILLKSVNRRITPGINAHQS
jgi:NSS family neurotransmitter:Na+ symporter